MGTDRHRALGAHSGGRKSWKRERVSLAETQHKRSPSGCWAGILGTQASSLGLAAPEPGTLLVEVPTLPCTPVSNLQHLHDDVIPLPAALP